MEKAEDTIASGDIPGSSSFSSSIDLSGPQNRTSVDDSCFELPITGA